METDLREFPLVSHQRLSKWRVEQFYNDSLTASALSMMPKPELVRMNLLGRHRICRNPTATFSMRLLLTAASTLLLWVPTAFGFADFSGKWVLDLRASSSPHAMLQRLGASWVERKFGGLVQMEASYTQTPQLLTVDRQGFGFRKTDVIRIDSDPEIQQNSLLGRYTIRTYWSETGTQLISDISFRTKDSRDAQMTVVRELADGGKTLVWSSTLKIAGESGSWALRHVWRKRRSP